ncbi:TPA: hypothetical protein DIV55_02500 [Patescibacteria group bacterium]|nr:hypothetical protein [Patescibacteria group bacterium]
MLERLVFTFGTLYPDEIITALLGTIPRNFYATLSNYSIFKGGATQLPEKARLFFESRNYDPQTFSYLFAKEDIEHDYTISGRVYTVNIQQELILDHWELYPDWYRKQDVLVIDKENKSHEAFIYTLDYDGERLSEFKRVLNDPEKVLKNANATRQRVMDKFPKFFNHI